MKTRKSVAKTEATPRPWTYEERCSGIVITNCHPDIPDETIIAMIIPKDEEIMTDEDEANAELIVKAVNNYDRLVEHLTEIHNRYKSLMTHKINDKTEKLIKKIKQ